MHLPLVTKTGTSHFYMKKTFFCAPQNSETIQWHNITAKQLGTLKKKIPTQKYAYFDIITSSTISDA